MYSLYKKVNTTPVCHYSNGKYIYIMDVESENQDFESNSSVLLQQLQDTEELPLDSFDVDRYDEYSIHLEEERSVFSKEETDSNAEQSDQSFEDQSDISLEEQNGSCLEQDDICFDEQSYLSSGEEKSDSEKNVEEENKLSSATKPDRHKLVEMYQSLQNKESVLLKQNYKLQMKLGAILKALEKRDYISIPDKAEIEEKYHALLDEIEEIWRTDAEQLEIYTKKKKELEVLLQSTQRNLRQMKNDLLSKQKHTALIAINTQTGKHICPEEIEMCFNRQAATDEEVRKARLKYVREKRRLKKLQNLPAEKDTSPGSENVHFLQYEELRIASETNQMQLEKLTQELRKMDNVFSAYIQMITHTKEKLLDLEPNTTYDDQSLDDEIIYKKEQLAYLKQKKNEAATRLERLRNHFGILSDQNLMRYYDKLQHDLHSLRIRITGIKSDLNEDNIKI